MDTSPEHDAEKCEAVFSDKREPFVQTSCSISLPWGHDGVIRHAFHGLGMHKDEPIAVNRQAAVQMGIRVRSVAERCQYGRLAVVCKNSLSPRLPAIVDMRRRTYE